MPFISNMNAVQFTVGINHLAYLNHLNELYVLGSNDYGQLGIDKSCEPQSINAPVVNTFFRGKTIKKITTGDRHTLVLLDDGKLYAFGDNSFNQCVGVEHKVRVPKLISDTIKTCDVFSGSYHNFLLNDCDELLSWGDNSFEKLGYNCGRSSQQTPRLIPYLNGYSIGMVSLSCNQSIVVTREKTKKS